MAVIPVGQMISLMSSTTVKPGIIQRPRCVCQRQRSCAVKGTEHIGEGTMGGPFSSTRRPWGERGHTHWTCFRSCTSSSIHVHTRTHTIQTIDTSSGPPWGVWQTWSMSTKKWWRRRAQNVNWTGRHWL